jgi:hypothetical protein
MSGFALMIKPFADERGDQESDREDGGEYGDMLLKCCEAALDFVKANESGDRKSAQKHYDELRDVCEQIDEHEDGNKGEGDDNE